MEGGGGGEEKFHWERGRGGGGGRQARGEREGIARVPMGAMPCRERMKYINKMDNGGAFMIGCFIAVRSSKEGVLGRCPLVGWPRRRGHFQAPQPPYTPEERLVTVITRYYTILYVPIARIGISTTNYVQAKWCPRAMFAVRKEKVEECVPECIHKHSLGPLTGDTSRMGRR